MYLEQPPSWTLFFGCRQSRQGNAALGQIQLGQIPSWTYTLQVGQCFIGSNVLEREPLLDKLQFRIEHTLYMQVGQCLIEPNVLGTKSLLAQTLIGHRTSWQDNVSLDQIYLGQILIGPNSLGIKTFLDMKLRKGLIGQYSFGTKIFLHKIDIGQPFIEKKSSGTKHITCF